MTGTRFSPTGFGHAAWMLTAAFVLAGCGDDSSSSASDAPFTESVAVEMVEEYYAAAAVGDAAAITAVFVDEPVIAGVDDLDEHVLFLAWDSSQGTELVDRSCRGAGEADPAGFVVVCDYHNHQYLQRVVDAPATPITETIVVTAEGIVEMDASYDDPLFPANAAFDRWMNTNHRSDATRADCCGGGGSIDDARADGELRRQYADLWAGYLEEAGCTYSDIGC